MLNATIPSHDGQRFGAYLAKAAQADAPVMLVIQEIFGVNRGLRDICDAWAQRGYHALCPDLFWRLSPGLELSDANDADMKEAFALFERFDVATGLKDLKSAIAYARSFESAKVGAVGYCLGGKLAFLVAAHTDIDCAVSYYGVGLEALLGDVPKIAKPLLMHIAAEDKFVPADAREKILAAVAANKKITAHVYEGIDHAFARVGGANYDAQAALLANSRTLAFVEKNLKQR